jgi:hypothetical protein
LDARLKTAEGNIARLDNGPRHPFNEYPATIIGDWGNATMTIAPATNANVKQAVPFFGVTNMEASIRFYVKGLGFEMKRSWVPDQMDHDYKPDGRIRWCWLQRGDAALMLQEFLPERRPKETLGTGISVCFMWRSIASSNHAG